MDGNGCRYGRWWGRHGLLLAGTAVLGFGLRLDLRCALRHINDDLYSSSESSGSAGSRGGAARHRRLRGLVAGAIYRMFPLSARPYARRYRRAIVFPARGRLGTSVCEGVFVGDVMTTSTWHCRSKTPPVCPSAVVVYCHWPRVALELALRVTLLQLRSDSPS